MRSREKGDKELLWVEWPKEELICDVLWIREKRSEGKVKMEA